MGVRVFAGESARCSRDNARRRLRLTPREVKRSGTKRGRLRRHRLPDTALEGAGARRPQKVGTM
jgi:hypothetical protein